MDLSTADKMGRVFEGIQSARADGVPDEAILSSVAGIPGFEGAAQAVKDGYAPSDVLNSLNPMPKNPDGQILPGGPGVKAPGAPLDAPSATAKTSGRPFAGLYEPPKPLSGLAQGAETVANGVLNAIPGMGALLRKTREGRFYDPGMEGLLEGGGDVLGALGGGLAAKAVGTPAALGGLLASGAGAGAAQAVADPLAAFLTKKLVPNHPLAAQAASALPLAASVAGGIMAPGMIEEELGGAFPGAAERLVKVPGGREAEAVANLANDNFPGLQQPVSKALGRQQEMAPFLQRFMRPVGTRLGDLRDEAASAKPVRSIRYAAVPAVQQIMADHGIPLIQIGSSNIPDIEFSPDLPTAKFASAVMGRAKRIASPGDAYSLVDQLDRKIGALQKPSMSKNDYSDVAMFQKMRSAIQDAADNALPAKLKEALLDARQKSAQNMALRALINKSYDSKGLFDPAAFKANLQNMDPRLSGISLRNFTDEQRQALEDMAGKPLDAKPREGILQRVLGHSRAGVLLPTPEGTDFYAGARPSSFFDGSTRFYRKTRSLPMLARVLQGLQNGAAVMAPSAK